MRIAMISSTDAYWTPLYARSFSEAGHEVRVFSLTPDKLSRADVDVVHVCGARPSRVPLAAWFLAQVPRVWWLLRRYAPDVVFATFMSSNGTVAALAWPGPLVASGHGGDVLAQLGRVPGGRWLHRHMMRLQGARASAIHVVADELAQTLIGYGVPPEKIAVIPLGVEVEQFEPASFPPESNPTHIVCTRRQEPVYANHVVVEALALLRDRGCDFRCTFIGGGPLLSDRRMQVAALGIDDRTAFTGQIPLAQVREMLQSAHIYVSASTTDGASSSLLEAMLCGAFPIVTRIPGNEPWINDGTTGLTFAVGDVDGLASALERAVRDQGLRAAAIEHNRALARRDGNLRLNMQRTLELLERAVEVRISSRAQGTRWRRKTPKNGPTGEGVIAGGAGGGAGTGRIEIASVPPV